MRRRSHKFTVRLDDELYDFVMRFSRAVGKTPTEIIRMGVDLMRLYYLGEGAAEGRGREAICSLLEALAGRALALSGMTLKQGRE